MTYSMPRTGQVHLIGAVRGTSTAAGPGGRGIAALRASADGSCRFPPAQPTASRRAPIGTTHKPCSHGDRYYPHHSSCNAPKSDGDRTYREPQRRTPDPVLGLSSAVIRDLIGNL